MKLKRDTKAATEAARRKAEAWRKNVRNQIKKDVLPISAEHCYQDQNSRIPCEICTQSDIKKCTSYSNLALCLNARRVLGVRGTEIKWDATRVRRLYV